MEEDDKKLADKIKAFLPYLNEAQKRIYLASETDHLGRGGKARISRLTGASHNTIGRGQRELRSGFLAGPREKIRKVGGGRKKKVTPSIWAKIEAFIEPHHRGEPDSPLQWVSKSLRNIEDELKKGGAPVSHRIIGDALREKGFSLQANRKTHEGKGHRDRDAQFGFIDKKVREYFANGQPVISVDAKKRELVGNFKNHGAEWHKKAAPLEVNAYDFLTDAQGVAIPYGVYDMGTNQGWVNVGITRDTAEFAVQSIRNWWYKMGVYHHGNATSLLITADGGGSNSSRGKLWKYELQKLANETGMGLEVAHFPPATSKWNKIEHRLFSQISKNWRGRPLVSYQVIVQLIASTKTRTGLDVECELDETDYRTGIKISENRMKEINIERSTFHGEWNYTIWPQMQ